jgi:hypothetical protein
MRQAVLLLRMNTPGPMAYGLPPKEFVDEFHLFLSCIFRGQDGSPHPDTTKLTVPEVHRELRIDDKYRETTRKLVKHREAPASQATRDYYTERGNAWIQIKRLDETVNPASGAGTRELVREWYRSPDVIVTDFGEPDEAILRLNYRLDGRQVCVMCTDDDATGTEADTAYFAPFAFQAREWIDQGVVDSAILLTRRRPKASCRDSGRSFLEPRGGSDRLIKIITLNEFIGTVLSIDKAASLVAQNLGTNQMVNAPDVLRVPFSLDREGGGHGVDALGALLEFCNSSTGGALAILGSYGTGKSMLLWMAANRFLQEYGNSTSQSPLPVIVDAKTLGDGQRDTLLNQIGGRLEQWYGRVIQPELISHLIQAGHLILFIDALDESPTMRNPRHIRHLLEQVLAIADRKVDSESRAVVVVTSRVELFDDHAQEAEIVTGSGFSRMRLRRLPDTESQAWLHQRLAAVNSALVRGLKREAELADAINDLLGTPLFLRIVVSVLSDTPLGTSFESETVLSEIYHRFTDKWFAREQPKAAGKGLPIDLNVRRQFCRQLSALIRGPEFRSQAIEPEVIRTLVVHYYVHILEMPRDAVLAQIEDLEFDAKHSSFLVRQDTTDRFLFSHDSFADFFMAQAITDALNVEWPVRPMPNGSLIDDLRAVQKWEKEVQNRIGLLGVLFREPLSKEKPLVEHFVHSILVARKASTGSTPIQVIEIALKKDRTGLESCLSENQLSILSFNLIYLRVAMSVVEGVAVGKLNLANRFLAAAPLDKLPTRDEKGQPSVYTEAGCIFATNSNLECTTLPVRANNEFVRGENILGPINRSERGNEWLIMTEKSRDRKSRFTEIAKFCMTTGIIKGQAIDPVRGWEEALCDADGFQWCIVPGAIYKQRVPRVGLTDFDVTTDGKLDATNFEQRLAGGMPDNYGSYMAKTFRIGAIADGEAMPYGAEIATTAPVALNSFLVQRHPVTNMEYLRFLREPSNAAYRRAAPNREHGVDANVRDNFYYLGGWDMVLEAFPDTLYTAPDFDALITQIDTQFPMWSKSPVVYVAHHHATAFAHYYGLELPTRCQMEAASRLYQNDPFWSDSTRSDEPLPETPWCTTAGCDSENCSRQTCHERCVNGWQGFVFMKVKSESPDAFPYFDCTEISESLGKRIDKYKEGVSDQNEDIDLRRFHAWMQGECIFPNNVPLHLMGCVSEWLRDVFDPNHAIGFHTIDNVIPQNPCNDGLWLEYDVGHKKWHPRRRGPYPENQRYAVREGSFRQPGEQYCKISKIGDIFGTAVNPDFGFRCVKRLVPKAIQTPM